MRKLALLLLVPWLAFAQSGGSTGKQTVPGATSTVRGTVKLTGQLGGTADSPTVTGITGAVVGVGNLNFTGTPSATTFARGDGSWVAPAGGGGNCDVTVAAATGSAATDRAAVTAAFTSGAGKKVCFPSGIYDLTGAVIAIPDWTYVEGAGVGNDSAPGANAGTLFVSSQAAFQFFSLGSFSTLKGVSFDRKSGGATPTSGAIILVTGISVRLLEIAIRECWDGILVQPIATTQAGGLDFDHINVKGVRNRGLIFDGAASGTRNIDSCVVSNFILSSYGTTNVGDLIVLNGHAEGLYFVNGILVGGLRSLYTTAAAYSQGNRPAYNQFVNVAFDYAEAGVSIADLVETSFTSCTFSASGATPTANSHGVWLGRSYHVFFSNCDFLNSWGRGLYVYDAAASHWAVESSQFVGNNRGGIGAEDVRVEAGVSDWIVSGNSMSNLGGLGGTTAKSVYVTAGASDRYIIDGNLLDQGITDGGTGIQKRVQNDAAPCNSVASPGNATCNNGNGRASIASAASAVTITNNRVTATSMLTATLQANDATCTFIKSVVPAAGSFTLTVNANCSAATPFSWAIVPGF